MEEKKMIEQRIALIPYKKKKIEKDCKKNFLNFLSKLGKIELESTPQEIWVCTHLSLLFVLEAS